MKNKILNKLLTAVGQVAMGLAIGMFYAYWIVCR